MRTVALLAWFILARPADGADPAGHAQATLLTTAEIDRRCRSAEASTKREPDRVFAEMSDEVVPRSAAGGWREFADPNALKGVGEDGAPNTQAFVWVLDGPEAPSACRFSSQTA